MKKLYLLLVFTFVTFFATAQAPFITTWEVTNDDLSITVPVYPDSNASNSNFNNYTIDFGDGTILTNQSEPAVHTYNAPGIYTVTLSGTYDRICFVNIDGSSEIKTVEQWGDNHWTSMYGAFGGCVNLVINATDVPDLSNVTDMSYMFGGCTVFNQSIDNWDVSHVMYMDHTFFAAGYDKPLNNWDVSNVVNMTAMFQQAIFNHPLDNWNVSAVTTMEYMFAYTPAFNQPLNNWNVSGVQNMHEMFRSTAAFSQDLNDWDVSHVTNVEAMFQEALAFNGAINNWDVSNLTEMENMFRGAVSFNQPLNNWDVSNVTVMANMFYMASSFNQPLNNWDISNAYYVTGMFGYAESFNQDISTWSYAHPWINFGDFVAGTALDTNNYDALLLKFAQLGIEDRSLTSYNLKYCNTGVHDYLINELNWDVSGDSLGEECQGNIVVGIIQYDEAADGCSPDDVKVPGMLVNAVNGPFNYGTISSEAEGYSLNVPEGNYTIQVLNLPSYFTATPATQSVSFTGFGNNEPLDFCLTVNQQVNDLNVTIVPISEARPGFQAEYRLVIQNIGTQTISGVTASMSYPVPEQSFVSASQTPSAINLNPGSVTFDMASLQPFETKTIDVTLQTATPPLVNGGFELQLGASVTPNTADYTPEDNTFGFLQTVVNAYDPNDKTVVQGAHIVIGQLDEYLDYVVRFQNTGTASAITVRIDDVLDANLDWTTLRPVNASHSYRVEITEGNHVSFIFDNINLPAETEDEPGSNGFIAFKIKPLQTLQLGDVISGSAAIYFDYNEPIITNTVTTTVVEAILDVANNENNKSISVYPNPVNDVLYLNADADIAPQEVKIYNMQGRELLCFNQNLDSVNLQSLSAGLYIVTVKTDAAQLNYRIIKK